MKIFINTEDFKKEIKKDLPHLPKRKDAIIFYGQDYEVIEVVFDFDKDEIIIDVM